MIEISHLTKKYGNHVAVDDLSLTVKPGKIYGFLGPNGAGKSTTMNIITGYLGATDGEVKINGFDIFAQPEEAKKCVGYLPEMPPLYQEMTVWEYLSFVAELKRIKKEVRKMQVEEVMELTGTTDMKNRLIRNLSKGYKQRVGLAQAILGEPEVIILDEPTVGLDPKQIIEMRDLIRELGREHTVILSSHILSEVSEICDHIFIISKGKLVASDTTENLSHRLQSTPEVHMEIKGQREEIESVLEGIEAITSYEIGGEAERGVLNVIVKAQSEENLRENLSYAFAAAKLPIYGMRMGESSLEDVVLKLTQEDADDETEEDYEEDEFEEDYEEADGEDEEGDELEAEDEETDASDEPKSDSEVADKSEEDTEEGEEA